MLRPAPSRLPRHLQRAPLPTQPTHFRTRLFDHAPYTFDHFRQAHAVTQESLALATTIVSKHPHLHPGYDTMLAQCYFVNNDMAHAILYTQAAQQRSSKLVCAPAASFGHTTTLILSGEYAIAYQEAFALEAILFSDPHFPRLRAYNLLRLLFLAKQLGDNEATTQWSALLQAHPAYHDLAPLFQQNQLTLTHYLNMSAKKHFET